MAKFYNSLVFGFGVLILMLGFSVLYFRFAVSDISAAGGLIDLEFPKGAKIVDQYDSHGGFQDEGEYWAVIDLTSKQTGEVLLQLKANNNWHKLPMPKEMQMFFSANDVENGKSLTIPEHGYYFFRDRYVELHPEFKKTSLSDPKRRSYNYIIGIYDNDFNKIYIWKCDS
ncbi:MAG: hypothetical protein ACM3UZ_02680 [Acidobacteriota bacterium]